MNDIKLSNISLPATASSAEASKTAAPPPTSDAQKGKGTEEVKETAQVKSLAEAKAAESEKQQEPKETELKEAVTKLNDYIQSVQRNLEFNVDDDSGRTVVKVVDRNTNEVVRQIPDEQALKMAQNLQQDEPLSLFTMKV